MKLRDKPCERCGWKFPGFHICVDLSRPCAEEGKIFTKRQYKNGFTDSHREALSDSMKSRWEKRRLANAERDAKIVARYKEGLGYRRLTDEFGLGYRAIMTVLKHAQAEGAVVIRPPGTNTRYLPVGSE